jgi:hypothetical protein
VVLLSERAEIDACRVSEQDDRDVAEASSLTVVPAGLGSTSPAAFAPPTKPAVVKTMAR